ncbi:mucin-5AC-like isoform X2 [Folsomia candida]|nr:mucin-5AC-like isoform X2 [Folsomia candida]
MATFETAAEANKVKDLIYKISVFSEAYDTGKEPHEFGLDRRYWFGLTDEKKEGEWVWMKKPKVEGTPVSNVASYRWYPKQPDHITTKSAEHCAGFPVYHKDEQKAGNATGRQESHYFNDYPCDMKMYFICKNTGDADAASDPSCTSTASSPMPATDPSATTTPPASGNATIPAGNATVPAGNATIPAGNATVPAGDATIPAGNETIPARNTTVPAGNATIPAGNETIPAANSTVAPPSNATSAAPASNETSTTVAPAAGNETATTPAPPPSGSNTTVNADSTTPAPGVASGRSMRRKRRKATTEEPDYGILSSVRRHAVQGRSMRVHHSKSTTETVPLDTLTTTAPPPVDKRRAITRSTTSEEELVPKKEKVTKGKKVLFVEKSDVDSKRKIHSSEILDFANEVISSEDDEVDIDETY